MAPDATTQHRNQSTGDHTVECNQEQIDQVAQAILNKLSDLDGGPDWANAPEASRDSFRHLAQAAMAAVTGITQAARPLDEYHEELGDVLWWKFPITEPPYVGSPLDRGHDVVIEATVATALGSETKSSSFRAGGWPGYHTHWTPILAPNPRSRSTEQAP